MLDLINLKLFMYRCMPSFAAPQKYSKPKAKYGVSVAKKKHAPVKYE